MSLYIQSSILIRNNEWARIENLKSNSNDVGVLTPNKQYGTFYETACAKYGLNIINSTIGDIEHKKCILVTVSNRKGLTVDLIVSEDQLFYAKYGGSDGRFNLVSCKALYNGTYLPVVEIVNNKDTGETSIVESANVVSKTEYLDELYPVVNISVPKVNKVVISGVIYLWN